MQDRVGKVAFVFGDVDPTKIQSRRKFCKRERISRITQSFGSVLFQCLVRDRMRIIALMT